MDYRYLGQSGLKVSAITFGTMTFGGQGVLAAIGSNDLKDARRQIDMCLDAGVNLYDTADTYGGAETVLGQVIAGRRERMLIATKVRFPAQPGENDSGLSRHHIISACENSLKAIGIDHIDLYQLHGWDGRTPLEETLGALDHLVSSGKVRYVGVSNFSGWHLMKTLATAERARLPRPVSQQIHYSLAARDAEYELAPISIDQGVGILVWGPLSGGLLSGKYRRGQPAPAGTRRAATGWNDYAVQDEAVLYDTVDVLLAIAAERGATASQIALAWLMGRPGVASLIIGARNEEQLAGNLAAADLQLSPEERARLDKVSAPPLIYPYWHQARYAPDRLSPADLTLLADHTNL